jgi:hypothetical protein
LQDVVTASVCDEEVGRMNCTHNTNNCIKIVIELLLTISILEIVVLAVWTAAHVKVAFLALKDVWIIILIIALKLL